MDIKSETKIQEFHKFIVDLTKNSTLQNIISRDSQTIYELIIKDYEKNIKLAASRGVNYAYLCIYETKAKYKGLIPIDSFIHMNEHMKLRFDEFKLEPVMDRIKKKLHPFLIEVKTLSESDFKKIFIPNKSDVSDSIIREEDPEDKKDSMSSAEHIVAIIASW